MSAEMITKCHQHNENTTPPLHDDIRESGENGVSRLSRFTKSRLLPDTCRMKMNLNGENTDFSSPPPVFRGSIA